MLSENPFGRQEGVEYLVKLFSRKFLAAEKYNEIKRYIDDKFAEMPDAVSAFDNDAHYQNDSEVLDQINRVIARTGVSTFDNDARYATRTELAAAIEALDASIDYRIDLGTAEEEFIPYIVHLFSDWGESGLRVTFPDTLFLFCIDYHSVAVGVPSFSVTLEPDQIMDIWIDSEGHIIKHTSTLDGWSELPMYDDSMVHFVRMQSNETAIVSVVISSNTYKICKDAHIAKETPLAFSDNYIVPDTTPKKWTYGAVAERCDVFIDDDGDLWLTTAAGTLGDVPENHASWQYTTGGTAKVMFCGRRGYENIWKIANCGKIIWYFSFIAAGYEAKTRPEDVKKFIDASFKHLIFDWISGQPYEVGMCVGGEKTNGYVWLCTKAGTTTGANPFKAKNSYNTATALEHGDTVNDGTVIWECVDVYNGTAKWFWRDWEQEMRQVRAEDSHDSYAAMFVWMIWQYIKATNDTAWLNNNSPFTPYTNLALLWEVIYFNLLTQIDPAYGLTKTFQNDKRPQTGEYAARFLMDNCEAYAGLKAMQEMLRHLGGQDNNAKANSLDGYLRGILLGLEGLYDLPTGAFRYEAGTPREMIPEGKTLFYPWIMAQGTFALWDVPVDWRKQYDAFEWANKLYPMWWARNDTDSTLSIGAHLGLLKFTQNEKYRQDIIYRIQDFQRQGREMYIHDYAYVKAIEECRYLKKD